MLVVRQPEERETLLRGCPVFDDRKRQCVIGSSCCQATYSATQPEMSANRADQRLHWARGSHESQRDFWDREKRVEYIIHGKIGGGTQTDYTH